MINYDTFSRLYAEAADYSDIDMYIAERGWQDWMDGMSADEIADILKFIYNLRTEGMNTVTATEPKLTRLARRYGIPYRTILKWVSGERAAPDYMIALLGYAVLNNKISAEE